MFVSGVIGRDSVGRLVSSTGAPPLDVPGPYLDVLGGVYSASLRGAYSMSRVTSTNLTGPIAAKDHPSGVLAGVSVGWNADDTYNQASVDTLGANVGAQIWGDQIAATTGMATHNNITNMPKMKDAGVHLGYLKFDGVDDIYSTGVGQNIFTSGTRNAATVYVRGRLRSLHPTQQNVVFEQVSYVNATGGGGINVSWNGLSSELWVVMSGAGPIYSYAKYALADVPANVTDVCAFRYRRNQVAQADQVHYWLNGALKTPAGYGGSAVGAATVFGNSRFMVASRFSANTYCPFDYHTILVYEVAHSDAEVALISAYIAALP